MAVDHEPPINTVEDMNKFGGKLYLPFGTSFVAMMKDSPFQSFRDAYREMAENEQYYEYVNGYPTKEFEKVNFR